MLAKGQVKFATRASDVFARGKSCGSLRSDYIRLGWGVKASLCPPD